MIVNTTAFIINMVTANKSRLERKNEIYQSQVNWRLLRGPLRGLISTVRTVKIFGYFANISVNNLVLQVQTLILTKFCQAVPNFKGVVVLPRRSNVKHDKFCS